METMIVIVGAGVGGLALAHELLKQGVSANEIKLLESSPQIRPAIGGGFALSAGLHCLLEGATPDFQQKLTHIQCKPQCFSYIELNGYRFGTMERMDAEFLVYGHFLRSELLTVLANTLPAGILLLDHKVIQIQQDQDNVTVKAVVGKDAREVVLHADILVGADGIKSVVRRECFRPASSCNHETEQTCDLRKFAGINSLYHVIPQSDIQDIVQSNDLMKENGVIAINEPSCLLLPTGSEENRSWVFLCAYPSETALERVQAWHQIESLEDIITDEDPELQTILDQLESDTTMALPLKEIMSRASRVMNFSFYETTPCKEEWFQGRIVLVGDSIHATTPFLAQGANQAIQSATCLAKLIASKANEISSTNDWTIADCEEIFERYRDIRFPVTKDITARSAKIGKMRTCTSTLTRWFRYVTFHLLFLNDAKLFRSIMAK